MASHGPPDLDISGPTQMIIIGTGHARRAAPRHRPRSGAWLSGKKDKVVLRANFRPGRLGRPGWKPRHPGRHASGLHRQVRPRVFIPTNNLKRSSPDTRGPAGRLLLSAGAGPVQDPPRAGLAGAAKVSSFACGNSQPRHPHSGRHGSRGEPATTPATDRRRRGGIGVPVRKVGNRDPHVVQLAQATRKACQ